MTNPIAENELTVAPVVESTCGWLAVAPNGAMLPNQTLRSQKNAVELALSWMVFHSAKHSGLAAALDDAYRAGWRVIRVQISPVGEEAGRGHG